MSTKLSRNSIISEVKNESYASTKPELPSRNSIISEVKDECTKPELPSRNVPRFKYIKGGINKKDEEDIELYEEP